MKIKNGFELREVCGEHIVLAYGRENIDFNKVIRLNDSAAYLWHEIQDKEFTVESLTELLCKEYEVDQETAASDVKALTDEWIEVGLVE